MNTNTNAIFGFNDDGTLKAPYGFRSDGVPRKNNSGRPSSKASTPVKEAEARPVQQVILNRKGTNWTAQFSSYKGEGPEVALAMNNLKENVRTAFVHLQSVADFLEVSTPLTELKEKVKAKTKVKAKSKVNRHVYTMTPENNARMIAQPFRIRKEVNQFTPDGVVVNTFVSVREAARSIKCSPQQIRFKCEDGKPYKGFIWAYASKTETQVAPEQPVTQQEI